VARQGWRVTLYADHVALPEMAPAQSHLESRNIRIKEMPSANTHMARRALAWYLISYATMEQI